MSQLPVALRPAWSSSSFLVYAGALTVLVSLVALLGDLADRHGSWALAGWTALVLAVLVALTARFHRDGRPVVAGLTAFVAVAITGVLAGALLDGIGLADGVAPFDDELELAPLVVEAAVLAAALFAARQLRFPLLMLAATVAQVVLVLDLVAGIFGGGNWLQWAALLLGLVELAFARALDGDPGRRPWAFWKHVAAALLIGGASVTLLDSWAVGWVLIGLLALAFLGLARAFERSVWALVGAFGLFLVTTHFVDESDTIVDTIPIVPVQGNGDGLELWQTSLVYVGLGAALVLLGKLLRQPTLHDNGAP
jgi:hypothetical protein